MATCTEKQPATYSESWSRGQQWPWGYITASNSFHLKEITSVESFNRKLPTMECITYTRIEFVKMYDLYYG